MFSWDQTKDCSNQRKHGVSFETAKLVFDDALHLSRQDRVVRGEQRWQTLRRVRDEALLVAHACHDTDQDGEYGPFYLSVWNGLTIVQQRVLAAAIHERGLAMTSASVTQRCRISPGTMSKTLKFLEGRQILRREEQKDTSRWRLEDPFFAAWLRSSASA